MHPDIYFYRPHSNWQGNSFKADIGWLLDLILFEMDFSFKDGSAALAWLNIDLFTTRRLRARWSRGRTRGRSTATAPAGPALTPSSPWSTWPRRSALRFSSWASWPTRLSTSRHRFRFSPLFSTVLQLISACWRHTVVWKAGCCFVVRRKC